MKKDKYRLLYPTINQVHITGKVIDIDYGLNKKKSVIVVQDTRRSPVIELSFQFNRYLFDLESYLLNDPVFVVGWVKILTRTIKKPIEKKITYKKGKQVSRNKREETTDRSLTYIEGAYISKFDFNNDEESYFADININNVLSKYNIVVDEPDTKPRNNNIELPI